MPPGLEKRSCSARPFPRETVVSHTIRGLQPDCIARDTCRDTPFRVVADYDVSSHSGKESLRCPIPFSTSQNQNRRCSPARRRRCPKSGSPDL